MAITRKDRSTDKGSSASVGRTIVDIVRLLRTFDANQLAGSPDQSECREPNEGAPKPAPQTWLEQHIARMTDDLADLITDRLKAPPPTTRGDSLLLTKAQVAAELQCSTKTVDRWVAEGLMPQPLQIGGALRWSRKDLIEWLAAGGPKA